MVSQAVARSIIEEMDHLPLELQKRVLDFAHALAESTPSGTPGKDLLAFCGTIPDADLDTMSKAIEDGCERVDADAW